MAGDSKLGIIIGCSLGGAALVFIIILILVCLFLRRKPHGEVTGSTIKNSSATTIEEDVKDKFSIQRSGLPIVQQSAFIRTGSQQWKSNISLTSAPPNNSSIDKQQRNLHASNDNHVNLQNNVNYQPILVPWYMRTLGRARQFLLRRPVADQSKRESGENLVENRYSATSAEGARGPISAYALNKSIEDPLAGKDVPLSHSGAFFNYGSQAALITNDVIASSSDIRRIASADQHYQAKSLDYRRVVQSNGDYYKTPNTQPRPGQLGGPAQHNYAYRQYIASDNRRLHSSGEEFSQKTNSWDDASTQLSLPRPTVINKQDAAAAQNIANRDRILSIMPPNGRHPTRPDTPQYDPQRNDPVHSSNKNNQKVNPIIIQPQVKSTAVSDHQPRSPYQASSSSEEKKIGDAFKFLDDMDE